MSKIIQKKLNSQIKVLKELKESNFGDFDNWQSIRACSLEDLAKNNFLESNVKTEIEKFPNDSIYSFANYLDEKIVGCVAGYYGLSEYYCLCINAKTAYVYSKMIDYLDYNAKNQGCNSIIIKNIKNEQAEALLNLIFKGYLIDAFSEGSDISQNKISLKKQVQ